MESDVDSTDRDEDILWRVKRVVCARERKRGWWYLVDFEESVVAWQYFTIQRIDNLPLQDFTISHRRNGERCTIQWRPQWRSAKAIPAAFLEAFWQDDNPRIIRHRARTRRKGIGSRDRKNNKISSSAPASHDTEPPGPLSSTVHRSGCTSPTTSIRILATSSIGGASNSF